MQTESQRNAWKNACEKHVIFCSSCRKFGSVQKPKRALCFERPSDAKNTNVQSIPWMGCQAAGPCLCKEWNFSMRCIRTEHCEMHCTLLQNWRLQRQLVVSLSVCARAQNEFVHTLEDMIFQLLKQICPTMCKTCYSRWWWMVFYGVITAWSFLKKMHSETPWPSSLEKDSCGVRFLSTQPGELLSVNKSSWLGLQL